MKAGGAVLDVAIDVDGAGSDFPPELSRADAATLTARIAQALDHTERLIAAAFVGRAWKALGFSSWDAWVDDHFGDRPMLVTRRSERTVTVAALSAAGMSTRAIGRALGIHARTVRRELAESPDAATAASHPAVIGSDGKTYPRPSARTCGVCGEVGHTAPDCPENDADLFGPITATSPEDVDLERTGSPGASKPACTEGKTGPDLDGADTGNCDDDDDAQDIPLPDVCDGPRAVAAKRVSRISTVIDRVRGVHDNLEQMPRLLASLAVDLKAWPTDEVTPRGNESHRLASAIAAVRQQLAASAKWLDQAESLLPALSRISSR